MDKEKKKAVWEEILKGVEWVAAEPKHPGGQQCGIPIRGQMLVHADMGIKISISVHRSQMQNRKLAMQLFELAVMEVVNW